MPLLHFRVEGDPKPKGSKKVFLIKGKPRLIEASGHPLTRWRNAIAKVIEGLKLDGPLIEGPVSVNLMFWLRRPKTTKFQEPIYLSDLDKLSRGVIDEFTGRIIKDDGQVVVLNAVKSWSTEKEPPGVDVVIEWRT